MERGEGAVLAAVSEEDAKQGLREGELLVRRDQYAWASIGRPERVCATASLPGLAAL